MNKNTNVVIFITSRNEEAPRITTALLRQKKVACVNVIANVSSHFWWQGELDSAQESLLIIKTKASQVETIVTLIKSIHGYAVPEIIALPIVGGNPDYLEWIGKEVK